MLGPSGWVAFRPALLAHLRLESRMSCLRTALLSATLLAASAAAAQATPAAPAVEPGVPQATAALAPAAPTPTASTPAEGVKVGAPPTERYGLGVSLGGRGWDPTLYVPMDLGQLRLEFEAAYTNGSADDADASSGHLGLGVFGLVPTSPGMQAYVGGRLQYVHAAGTGATSNGVRAAFALGGEWAPAPSVALGVEWQVGYTAASGAAKGVDTTALAFLRVFLVASSPEERASLAAKQAKAPRTVKCTQDRDCAGLDICFDGYCRR